MNKDWTPFSVSSPAESETVWLYNVNNGSLALGCLAWVESRWLFAISNGVIYTENGKIVAECELDDDYEFTHWAKLPELPN